MQYLDKLNEGNAPVEDVLSYFRTFAISVLSTLMMYSHARKAGKAGGIMTVTFTSLLFT